MLDQRPTIRSYPHVRCLTFRPAPAALFVRPLHINDTRVILNDQNFYFPDDGLLKEFLKAWAVAGSSGVSGPQHWQNPFRF